MMTESVTIVVDGTSDDAIHLDESLNWDRELRGWARLVPGATPEGTLGADLTQLLVTLESGGMAAAFASVLVAWIKTRAGSVTVKVTRRDGTAIELKADRVRGLKPEDLQKQIAQLAAMSWPHEASATAPGDEPTDGNA
jgi:Effector Associated Constant Component 1